jgi:non-heme chloroperoxidase
MEGVTMPDVLSDEVRIHYDVEGDGEPVVLLHGMGSSYATGWAERGWTAALTGAGFRVIGVDARGHGLSQEIEEPRLLRNGPCVGDLARVLDACGVERAHLAGYSLGAGQALRMAIERPERVCSLVLGGLGGIALAAAGLYHRSACPAPSE